MEDKREADTKHLRLQFRDKFREVPEIRYMYCGSYGYQYCIFKIPSFTVGMIGYYKMGDNFHSAVWYINNLIIIPSAVITFKSDAERILWNKDEVIRMAQIEMDLICSNEFEQGSEKYIGV